MNETKQPSTRYVTSHAYARSAACCCNYSLTSRNEPTLTIDFALAASGGYDWKNKVAFQLSRADLSEFCGFMLYPWASYRWVHKTSDDVFKSLTLRHQHPNIYFELTAPSSHFGVPVVPSSQYEIRNVAVSRLFESQPPLPPSIHLHSLRQLAEMLANEST